MALTRFLLTFCILGLSAQARAQTSRVYPGLNVIQYNQIRNLALEIAQIYPPAKTLYVGVGRSPTPVVAFFKELLGEDRADTLPLSSLHRHEPGHPSYLPLPDHDALMLHFKRFLPGKSKASGRKVLLFDFAHSGRSLINLKREVESFVSSDPEYVGVKFDFLAMAGQDPVVRQELERLGVRVLRVPFPLRENLRHMSFDPVAEFDAYPVSELHSIDLPPRRPSREERLSALERRLKRLESTNRVPRHLRPMLRARIEYQMEKVSDFDHFRTTLRRRMELDQQLVEWAASARVETTLRFSREARRTNTAEKVAACWEILVNGT